MFQTVAIYALVSAFFYCVSMIAMKSYAAVPQFWPLVIIAASLVFAVVFEIAALKQERLGLIYVGILAAEVVILGAVSLVQYDEAYAPRELLGMAIVLVGTAVAWT